MKRILMITVLTLQLSLCALSQNGDWHAVQALPAGTKIKVQLKHGHTFGHCFFDGATNDQLACSIPGPIWMGSRRATYPRNNVKAVFWTHNGALIGFGVGATTGAILGASKDPVPGLGRGGTALLVGGLMGGVGAFFGMVADPFFHGKAVYRSSRMAPSNASPNQHINLATTQTKPAQREEKIPCLRDGRTLQCLNPSPVDAVEDDN